MQGDLCREPTLVSTRLGVSRAPHTTIAQKEGVLVVWHIVDTRESFAESMVFLCHALVNATVK